MIRGHRILLALMAWQAGCFVAQADPPRAEAPRVTFEVKKSWMTCRVTREGTPVAASMEIFDEQGRAFASGEAADGVGEFPLPPGETFTLAVRVNDKTADSIRLTRDGVGVFPSEVLLSFGLAPCCQIRKVAASVPTTPAESDGMLAVAIGLGVVLAGAVGGLVWLGAHSSPMRS